MVIMVCPLHIILLKNLAFIIAARFTQYNAYI